MNRRRRRLQESRGDLATMQRPNASLPLRLPSALSHKAGHALKCMGFSRPPLTLMCRLKAIKS